MCEDLQRRLETCSLRRRTPTPARPDGEATPARRIRGFLADLTRTSRFISAELPDAGEQLRREEFGRDQDKKKNKKSDTCLKKKKNRLEINSILDTDQKSIYTFLITDGLNFHFLRFSGSNLLENVDDLSRFYLRRKGGGAYHTPPSDVHQLSRVAMVLEGHIVKS